MWLREYVPVLLAVAFFGGLGLLASALAGRWGGVRAPGTEATAVSGEPHTPLALRLYPLVLAFLVFDVAVVTLYPWAVYLGQPARAACSLSTCPGGLRLFAAGATFVAVAAVAWLVVRRTRAAEWNA